VTSPSSACACANWRCAAAVRWSRYTACASSDLGARRDCCTPSTSAAGEPLDELNEELGFDLDEEELARQQAKYEKSGRTWEAVIDGRHGHAHKIHSGIREYLYARKKEDDSLRAPHLAQEVEKKFGIAVSAGHINYLLRKRELTAPPGRPSKKPESDEEASTEIPNESVGKTGPTVLLRDGGRLAELLLPLLGHLEEQQVGDLFDVVAVGDAVVAQDVAIVP